MTRVWNPIDNHAGFDERVGALRRLLSSVPSSLQWVGSRLIP
jgi:hypothetical protein